MRRVRESATSVRRAAGRAREGVALLLSKRLAENVTEWMEVSSRLICVKLKLDVDWWAVVSANGPGCDRREEERNNFWMNPSECVGSFCVQQVQRGKSQCESWRRGGGECGMEIRCPRKNDSGENLRNLCMEQELVVIIVSTRSCRPLGAPRGGGSGGGGRRRGGR